MDAAADPLPLDDLPQQGDQALAIGVADPSHQFLFVLPRDPAPAPEKLATGVGQVQGADSTIARMRVALDQATALELIDDGDHAARRRPDRLGDRMLRLALGGIDHVQDPEQRWMQVDRRDSLGKSPGGVCADLREQEADGGGRPVAGNPFATHIEKTTVDYKKE